MRGRPRLGGVGQDRQITLLTGGSERVPVELRGASSDARTVFSETSESLPGTGDTDGRRDVYRARDGRMTLLTRGDDGSYVRYRWSSADGTRMLFEGDDIAGTGARPRLRPNRRTVLRFTLSEPAAVTMTIARARPGRRAGGRCRAPTRRNARRPRCTRHVVVARLRRDARAGANRVMFSGRVIARRLRPGRYRVTAVARDAAGNVSGPRRARVVVVRAAAG